MKHLMRARTKKSSFLSIPLLIYAFRSNLEGDYASNNGVNFTPVQSPGRVVKDSIYVNGKLTVVGYDSSTLLVMSSTDGEVWKRSRAPFAVLDVCSITYGNGMYVIIDSANQIYYSTDTEYFTKATIPDWSSSTLDSMLTPNVCFGGGKFLAYCKNGKLYQSADGINWAVVAYSVYYNELSYANGWWYGGGYAGDPSGHSVFRSPDGSSWTRYNQDSGTSSRFKQVIWDGVYYWTIREDGRILRSLDGTTFGLAYNKGTPAKNIAIKGTTMIVGFDDGYCYITTTRGNSASLNKPSGSHVMSHWAIF